MKNDITNTTSILIDAPVSKVWDALTKPEIIEKYFFGTKTTTDWKPGSPIKFEGEWQGKSYIDKGTILEVEKNKLIKYSYWSSMSGIEDKPENYVPVTYRLSENGSKTFLEIVQENIPDEKMREHSNENWKKVLGGLKQLLEKNAVKASL